ncbi:MAG TPA: ornithine cyclodeaminase family protein [Bryobacteraceae bacterium]|nr:ornithine cyclodeaminase family protein [Bryobacteraceae bacterium]
MPLVYVTEEEVKRLLPMRECIAAMRRCFDALAAGAAINQPRRRLVLPTGSMLHSMAGAYDRYFGTKVYATNPRYGADFTFHLYDADTAEHLAQFEANHLGQIRTGATTGYAIDRLAKADARVLSIIGSGFQAKTQLEAAIAVRPIQVLKVYSRKPENRQKFAEEASERYGIFGVVCSSPEEALDDADILITATFSGKPVFHGGWGRGPLLVCAMGSNHPDRRELPPELIREANLLVADDVEQARLEAGDYLLALSENDWARVKPLTEVTGPVDGLVVFKSVGLGVEDVAAAAQIYDKLKNVPTLGR